MAASLRSLADVPRQHLARARFPSLTEFPDSPSVYSPPDTSRLSQYDDESASTIRSLSSEDIRGDDSDIDDYTDDASHRISIQGPKIRFHSRAPWETDDVTSHADGPDMSPRSGTFGSKLVGKTSRADSLIRTFTRGRPSVDSARSQVSATSPEVTPGDNVISRGAPYNLARQSMSTSSLSSSAASASMHSQSFAPATTRPESPPHFSQGHSLTRTAVSLDCVVPPSLPPETVPMRPSSSDVSRTGRERAAKPYPTRLSQGRQSHHDDFVHPYANPDLVVLRSPSSETIPSYAVSGEMSGTDSNCTITDSISTTFAVASIETSPNSRDPPQGKARVNGKEISSPISVVHQNDASFVGRNNRFLSLHPPPTGFDGPPRSNLRTPAVTLISLQEAQARERFRGNTVHATVGRRKLPIPNAEEIPEAAEDRTEETDTASIVARARIRSTSAGTRQKIIPLAPTLSHTTEMTEEFANPASANSISERALKHKRSGFMRLFGSRGPEGERERSALPPVPPLGDRHVEQNSQIHGTGKTKLTHPRVAKPPSSPALPNANNASPGSDSTDGKGPSPRRRYPPSLSIVTTSSDHSIASSTAREVPPVGLRSAQPLPLSLSVPQSAPPSNTDFPGLQLRPVSASFSSHFADIVASVVEESQRDVHTPSSAASSSTALSPFTPVSTRRSDDASATALEVSGEENLTIRGLQDQLVSAKKAWQQQVWELRGQIRDLTAELESLRAADNQEYCEVCGRGESPKRHASPLDEQQPKKVSVVNRPRARTGDVSRFANGN